jgi:hypothetical protein
MKAFHVLFGLIFILTLSACGDGGGSDDDVIPSLDGSWGGNLEDSLGTMHNFTIGWS